MQSRYEKVRHTFSPVYDKESRILILGSLPSVKSRETDFYYGHPSNRFWKVLAVIFDCNIPQTKEEKIHMLLEHHVALWDVIASCEIIGSSDQSIRNVKPNRLEQILDHAPIEAIYTNGNKAQELYMRYCYPQVKIESVRLPSTSPANAAWGLEKLAKEWGSFIGQDHCSYERK